MHAAGVRGGERQMAPNVGDRTVSDLQFIQLLPTGCGRMPVMVRGETPAQQQSHSTSGDEWKVRFNTLSVKRDHPTDRMSTNAEDSDDGDEEQRLQTGPLLDRGRSARP